MIHQSSWVFAPTSPPPYPAMYTLPSESTAMAWALSFGKLALSSCIFLFQWIVSSLPLASNFLIHQSSELMLLMRFVPNPTTYRFPSASQAADNAASLPAFPSKYLFQCTVSSEPGVVPPGTGTPPGFMPPARPSNKDAAESFPPPPSWQPPNSTAPGTRSGKQPYLFSLRNPP